MGHLRGPLLRQKSTLWQGQFEGEVPFEGFRLVSGARDRLRWTCWGGFHGGRRKKSGKNGSPARYVNKTCDILNWNTPLLKYKGLVGCVHDTVGVCGVTFHRNFNSSKRRGVYAMSTNRPKHCKMTDFSNLVMPAFLFPSNFCGFQLFHGWMLKVTFLYFKFRSKFCIPISVHFLAIPNSVTQV